jgi:isocitrate lyase
MEAYAELQEAEFAAEADRYTATKHQREVGAGYFDEVAQVIAGRKARRPRWKAPPNKSSSIKQSNVRN